MIIVFVIQKIVKMTIGLLLLSTCQYKKFVQPLLNDVKKHFLSDHKIEVHLFTDDIHLSTEGDERVAISKYLIVSWRFPEITLYRYKIFTSKEYPNCDYLFYMDVDMRILDTIGDEVLGNIVATLHPGFYNGGGAWGDNKESLSYTFPENRIKYYAGGFSCGERDRYWAMMKQLSLAIEDDEKRNVLAEWHDETHFNKYLSELRSFKVLDPSYCMPEPEILREEWGLKQFPPRIIALDKNHEEIRQ